jgi:PHD/YefM family antitoxin component YafN of YafNO toxin-antitoxin module
VTSVDVTVTENQMKLVLHKLDAVRLELLRLRSMLLPGEELSEKERKELEEARKEIAEGSSVNLDELIKELG